MKEENKMSYYQASLNAINSVIKSKGISKVSIKDIDKAYPFGERAYYPYKAWLKARKYMVEKLNLTKAKEVKLDGLFDLKVD